VQDWDDGANSSSVVVCSRVQGAIVYRQRRSSTSFRYKQMKKGKYLDLMVMEKAFQSVAPETSIYKKSVFS
jgi:hypothetical protein